MGGPTEINVELIVKILKWHVMVNARVQHPDPVDVPENGNQSVEKMERRTVISVWQNVSKLHVKTNINVLKVADTD